MKKPKEQPQKSTRAQIEQRVSETVALLLQGFTRSDIVRLSSKYGVTDRQIDDYIAMATARIREANQASLQDNLAMICSNLWDLYRSAKTSGNLRECHAILNSLAKVRGLDKITVNHVLSDERELNTLADADLDALLAESADVAAH